ncbi:MAG: putative molybdenum carrier protein [Fidelibacterota bacterium]
MDQKNIKLKKIISGGQTGVDQIALDFAISQSIPIGGFCPRGRLCESGIIPQKYTLVETESEDYQVRTMRNVQESDGTLIIYDKEMKNGTLFTYEFCRKIERPVYLAVISGHEKNDPVKFKRWISEHQIQILNIAGPRASEEVSPIRVKKLLQYLFGIIDYL